MPAIDLTGRPIAITGASSGIGAATALACARAGMPVALGARRTDRLEALRQRIIDEGGRALSVRCDVVSPEDCITLIERARDTFGPVYSVFANAGIGAKHDVLATSQETLREMFEVNLFGTLHTIRAAAPSMIESKSGHILICSSCLSALPTPGYSVYSATKSAQHHLGRALGVELSTAGIHVTTVHPVRTETEFFEAMQNRQGNVPRGTSSRSQSAERVADAVVRVLRKPKPELWLSRPTELGLKLSALFPRLTDRLVWKARRR